LLVGTEETSVTAVGSAEVDPSNGLRKILIILLVLESNLSRGHRVRQVGVAGHVCSHKSTSRSVQDASGTGTRAIGLVGKSLNSEIVVMNRSVGSGQLILQSCYILGVEGHLSVVIVFVIGIFVLVIDRVRSETACLLREVEIGQVRSSELCSGRLWGLCKAKIVQGSHMNIGLPTSFF
jgi:hypothetical protein